jgi:hypothetical protein
MTFYYYCFLVVLPLRLEWKTRAKEKNPINVNVCFKVCHNKLKKGRLRAQKHKRQFEGEKLRHFLRGTALKIKFILGKEEKTTSRMDVVYPSSCLISLRHGFLNVVSSKVRLCHKDESTRKIKSFNGWCLGDVVQGRVGCDKNVLKKIS